MNQDIKKYFNEVRNCDKCKEEMRVRHPQPGILNKDSKYLFIFQNPAEPNPEKSPEDKILMTKDTNDGDFDCVYRSGYLKWHPYNRFIKLLIGNSMNFSILNICRCPTKNNQTPTCEMIEACHDFLIKGIEYVNPKIIICQGSVAATEIKALDLDKKYNVIFSKHYAYLARQSKEVFDNAIMKIKNKMDIIEENL